MSNISMRNGITKGRAMSCCSLGVNLGIRSSNLFRSDPAQRRSLRRALSEYVEHFHAERNHQGKGNVLLFPRSESGDQEFESLPIGPRSTALAAASVERVCRTFPCGTESPREGQCPAVPSE